MDTILSCETSDSKCKNKCTKVPPTIKSTYCGNPVNLSNYCDKNSSYCDKHSNSYCDKNSNSTICLHRYYK